MRPGCSGGWSPGRADGDRSNISPAGERLCWGKGCSGAHPARTQVPLRPARMVHYTQLLLIPVGISPHRDNTAALTVGKNPLANGLASSCISPRLQNPSRRCGVWC